jgi:addiction module HigA family antidote
LRGGEILREELAERGISLNRLARDTRIPVSRVSLIVNGKRAISPDTALRLEFYFGASAQYWLAIVSEHADEIAHEVIPARRSAA